MVEDLGPYRSALARGPSQKVFTELCDLLGDGGRGHDAPVVTYLEAHLRSWPTHIPRRAPERWWVAAGYADEHVPALRLCDTLDHELFSMAGGDAMFFESLLEVHRGWRRVELEGVDDTVCAALGHMEGVGLRSIALVYGWTFDDDVEVLAELPAFETVVEFDLSRCKVKDLGVLAGTPLWRGLEVLRAPRNAIEGEGLERALGSSQAATLRRMDLRYNPIGEVGARALASSPWLGNLEWLGLYVEDAGELGAEALGASATLPGHISAYWRGR